MENKDISQLRKSYDKNKLNVKDVNFQPMEFFKSWFQDALKNKNIEEANAMTLTTLGLDKFPKGRVVLLKSFTEEGFIFFTNYESEKGVSIDYHSKVGLSFFWPPLERQIIIKGEIEKISPEDSDDYFSSRPKGSQISALISEQRKVINSIQHIFKKKNKIKKKISEFTNKIKIEKKILERNKKRIISNEKKIENLEIKIKKENEEIKKCDLKILKLKKK